MSYPNSAFASEIEHLEWRISRRAQAMRDSQGEMDLDRAEAAQRRDYERLRELRSAQKGGAA